MAFLYRYLFVLMDEVLPAAAGAGMRAAPVCRAKAAAVSLLWRARVTGSMAGQLFLRSYERSERIYNAMISRGYTGHIRTLNPHELQPPGLADAVPGYY